MPPTPDNPASYIATVRDFFRDMVAPQHWSVSKGDLTLTVKYLPYCTDPANPGINAQFWMAGAEETTAAVTFELAGGGYGRKQNREDLAENLRSLVFASPVEFLARSAGSTIARLHLSVPLGPSDCANLRIFYTLMCNTLAAWQAAGWSSARPTPREPTAVNAPIIEQTKYTLDQVIAHQRATPTTVSLLLQLVSGVEAALRAQNQPVTFRTHIYGVTDFCTDREAFMFVNLRQDYITAVFYTGCQTIPGLPKANWLNSGDNAGSETVRISDPANISSAVAFASAAYMIAARETTELPRPTELSTTDFPGAQVPLPQPPQNRTRPRRHDRPTPFAPDDLTI